MTTRRNLLQSNYAALLLWVLAGTCIGGLCVQLYFCLTDSPRFDYVKVQVKVVLFVVSILLLRCSKRKSPK